MKNFLKKKKDGLVLFIAIIVIIVIFIGVNAAEMYSNLKTYGYGVKELPQTLAVYFRLSDGFTVEEGEDGESVFIGNKNPDFYSDFFSKLGYKEVDRMGKTIFCKKDDKQEESSDFVIEITDDSCNWFGIYTINNDYKIEDFK